MNKLMVIADDLTGACDTGIKFCEHGYRTRVLMPAALKDSYQDDSVDVFSVTTNTRNCSSEEAGRKISEIFEYLQCNYRYYKKIDSILRGNIIAELDSLIEKKIGSRSLICSAYIEEGRTIVDGNLHIRKNGDEVVESVSGKLGLEEYDHIGLDTVRKGADAVAEAVRAGKNRHVILDALTNEDLMTIARAAELLPECIPAGSAGLANQYCKCLFKEREPLPEPEKSKGLPLIIVGTRNPVSVKQVQELKKINFEVHLLNTDEYGTYVESVEVIKKRCRRGILLTTNLIFNDSGNNGHLLSKNCHNSNVLDAIEDEARKIFAENSICGIAAAGGDVCSAVLEALDLNIIDLNREVLPGIPTGQAIGRNNRKITIITKSGGFGNDEAFIKLYEYMRGAK